MAAVGLPCWTPGVWADTLWTLGVWRDAGRLSETLSGGWFAPPRRQGRSLVSGSWFLVDNQRPETSNQHPATTDAAAVAGSRFLVPGSKPETTNQKPETVPALLATARALPPLDWAPLQGLALADARRRQALAARQEEEELLVLLMLMEV